MQELNIEAFFSVPKIDSPPARYYKDTHRDEFQFCKDETGVEGLVMEFGVFEGKSINDIARVWTDQQVYGFDSFEGLPEDWDMGDGVVFTKDRFFNAGGVLPDVPDHVTLIKGFFDASLPGWWNANKNPISFLNIDSDLYSSAIFILETLNDYLLPGAIVRFDELCDWRLFDPRETRPPKHKYYTWAENEWKALNEWISKYDREVAPLARNYAFSSIVRIIK